MTEGNTRAVSEDTKEVWGHTFRRVADQNGGGLTGSLLGEHWRIDKGSTWICVYLLSAAEPIWCMVLHDESPTIPSHRATFSYEGAELRALMLACTFIESREGENNV
jgi:hypothetical protein